MTTTLAEKVAQLAGLVSSLKSYDQSFASGLVASFNKYGKLSPKQEPWVQKLLDRALQYQPAPKDVVVPEPVKAQQQEVEVGGFDAVLALFAKAKEHLKFPKITLKTPEGVVIKLGSAGVKSKYAGSILVQGDGKYPHRTYYGQITPEGIWKPSAAASHLPGLTPLLVAFGADPTAVAKSHGALTGNCCFCNKTLGLGEDKRSVTIGYGPVCAKHYGLYSKWLAAAEAPHYTTVAKMPVHQMVNTNLSDSGDMWTKHMASKEEAMQVAKDLNWTVTAPPPTTMTVAYEELSDHFKQAINELPDDPLLHDHVLHTVTKKVQEDLDKAILGIDYAPAPAFGMTVITDKDGNIIQKIPTLDTKPFAFTQEALEDIQKMAAEKLPTLMDETTHSDTFIKQAPWKTGMINEPLKDMESYPVTSVPTKMVLGKDLSKDSLLAQDYVTDSIFKGLKQEAPIPQVLKQVFVTKPSEIPGEELATAICYLCDSAEGTVLNNDYLICVSCAEQLETTHA